MKQKLSRPRINLFVTNMIKKIIILLCFVITHTMHSQVSEVKEEVNNAYEYYQDAYRYIQSASSNISYAFDASSVDEIQSYASSAESDLSSAKIYVGYAEEDADDAEDEASNLNCDDAEDSASDAEDYFYTAKNKLSYAVSELSSASYEDDVDYLADYLNNAKSYISEALTQLNYAVDQLNYTLKDINNCGVPSEASSYYRSNDTPACDDLLSFIENNGYSKGSLSNYTLDSDWLYQVKAYDYEYKIYVVAKIKKSEYSYQTNTYIFCGIPSTNWSNFKNGGYGDSNSYGERFHKYIIDYKCDCY
ncbi:hypothetical protein V6251_02915 [Olleya sp. Ti.3.14]|uniref:hypothetical protein n=1 Tax=Olleya sp. Ti.3.14 TaxID=3121297 RepID=UPI00311D5618